MPETPTPPARDVARRLQPLARLAGGRMTDRILIVDDTPALLDALAAMLRDHGHEVDTAASVADAAVALASAPHRHRAIVLDLVLDAPAAPLHRLLVERELPVVLVSGADPSALPEVARSKGWQFLAKPVDGDALEAALQRAITSIVPPPTLPLPRPSKVPKVDESTPSPPRGDSSPPLARTSERVAIHDGWSRTVRRSIASLGVIGLSLYFESKGHMVPWHIVAALTALGLGLDGAVTALKKRPGVAAGGAAALIGLALAGDATGVREVSQLAALGAGSIPFVDLIAARLRG